MAENDLCPCGSNKGELRPDGTVIAFDPDNPVFQRLRNHQAELLDVERL